MDDLEQQVRVSKTLGMAFVLSIPGIFGVGSLIALILGYKTLRTIQSADRRINGRLVAWWCILAGALGTLILLPLTIATSVKQLR